jgi:hypothetical protein
MVDVDRAVKDVRAAADELAAPATLVEYARRLAQRGTRSGSPSLHGTRPPRSHPGQNPTCEPPLCSPLTSTEPASS